MLAHQRRAEIARILGLDRRRADLRLDVGHDGRGCRERGRVSHVRVREVLSEPELSSRGRVCRSVAETNNTSHHAVRLHATRLFSN